MSNYKTIGELRKQGSQPATTVATPLAGKDGAQGEQGEKGDKGDTGLTGATGKAGRNGKDGRNGTDGKDGANGVDGQNGKDGVNGTNGTNGRDGTDGANGRTPELACVIRWDTDLPTVTRYYLAWKYTDEPNTAWRNISRINSNDRLPTCIDLRTT